LHKEKGLKYLIKSFRIITDKYSDTKLILTGNGPEKENLKILVAKYNLYNNIIFLDYFPYEKIQELYNICDVIILPSLFEPFGMALTEAMACGKPVIGSNIGGIKDIIQNGKNGFLIDPRNSKKLAEKIDILLSDDKLRIEFGKKGREKVQNTFSYSVVAKKAAKIYQKYL